MKRIVAILKYLPAVLCGLLVVVWVASIPVSLGVLTSWPGRPGYLHLGSDFGSVMFAVNQEVSRSSVVGAIVRPEIGNDSWFGKMLFLQVTLNHSEAWVPIPFLLTLLLPFAVGPFMRFRFPLWTWFAFTALVAVELAFYLR